MSTVYIDKPVTNDLAHSLIVGIDLGTTNSSIAVWQSGKVKVIPNVLGKLLTPSVISVDNNQVLVGEPALNRLVTYPALTIANFKRYMGSDKLFKLGDYSFRAEELSALILKRLKEDAENFLDCTITEAVISVPAYFSDAQRKATKTAGKLAGLKVERLINEPTAAGIAYGLQAQANETNYLIFDLGGGTFDVSILTMFSGVIEVRASSGDNLLGGMDFTQIISEMVLSDFKKAKQLSDHQMSIALRNKIYEQAELAKHQFSTDSQITLKLNWNSEVLEYQYTEKDFERFAESLLQRLREPVKKVLNDAKLSASQIDQVVLVGGATRMPLVKKVVSKMFGRFPLCHIDPDIVIAQGTAVQAGLKANDVALDEIVVTDVCPYSLGVAVVSNKTEQLGALYFDPLIERNTIIPVSRSRIYYPIQENQKKIEVKIYQGESFFIEKNIFLGNLMIDLPSGLKNPAVDIRFTYDINGLLEVEATIIETQQKKSIVIEGTAGALSEQQIQAQLAALQKIKIHPREETANLLLLSRAERLYEDLQGERRTYLGEVIKTFIQVLNEQNARDILRMQKQLEEILINLQAELNSI